MPIRATCICDCGCGAKVSRDKSRGWLFLQQEAIVAGPSLDNLPKLDEEACFSSFACLARWASRAEEVAQSLLIQVRTGPTPRGKHTDEATGISI